MSISRFTARSLTESVRILGDGRGNFLRNNVFSQGMLHGTDVIDFGKMNIKARIAVYQKKYGPAVPVNKHSGDIKTVIAPKIRIKKVFEESFAATLNPALPSYRGPDTDPAAQYEDKINIELADLGARIEKMEEVQCAQALQTGIITITYEDGSTATVDMEYSSNGTILTALTGDDAWNNEGSNPLQTLEDIADDAMDATDWDGNWTIIAGSTAYAWLMKNAAVLNLLDNRGVNVGQLDQRFTLMRKGNLNGFDIIKYKGGYVNGAGTRIQLWDPNIIALVPPQESMKATIEYGAVFDRMSPNEDANWQRTKRFVKPARTEDPPVDELIMESRPLALIKDPSAIRILDVIEE